MIPLPKKKEKEGDIFDNPLAYMYCTGADGCIWGHICVAESSK